MKTLTLATAAALLLASTAFAQQGTPGAHFLENWDADGNASVSAAEIAEKRSNVFASFDANEDGNLDASEYALFDEARANDQAQLGTGHGKGMKGMQELETPMERGFNDANNHGLVSAAEFAAASAAMFSRLDRNGDGQITTDDFGRT